MSAIFNLFDPIPFGFFVAALIFDVIYADTANIFWMKGAAWLVTLGLVFAIIPQRRFQGAEQCTNVNIDGGGRLA